MIGETKEEIKAIQLKRKNKIVPFLAGLLLALVLFSCDAGRIYENFYSFGTQGWNKDSIAVFKVDIQDTVQHYNLLINTRNLENYPYSNLWVFVDVVSPDNKLIRDTVEYELALPNGKWTGKGTGGVYENQFMLRQNVFFPRTGDYTFKIQHGMRDDELKGLKDVGFRIEKMQ